MSTREQVHRTLLFLSASFFSFLPLFPCPHLSFFFFFFFFVFSSSSSLRDLFLLVGLSYSVLFKKAQLEPLPPIFPGNSYFVISATPEMEFFLTPLRVQINDLKNCDPS